MPILEERSQLTNWHTVDTSDKYTNLRGEIRGGLEVPDPVNTTQGVNYILDVDVTKKPPFKEEYVGGKSVSSLPAGVVTGTTPYNQENVFHFENPQVSFFGFVASVYYLCLHYLKNVGQLIL